MNTDQPAVIFNYGSINIDHVYHVDHFVQPGETISSRSLQTGLGGKGANQSVAIARAGGHVRHIGQIGGNDEWALDEMRSAGVEVSGVGIVDAASGHAIIQVDTRGENAIVLHGGANQQCNPKHIDAILSDYRNEHTAPSYLLLQNECNALKDVVELALALEFRVVLNPAPMNNAIADLPLAKLDTLFLNEVEAQGLSGCSEIDDIVRFCFSELSNTRVVLTLGSRGAIVLKNGQRLEQAAFSVEVEDTTGAGDTFVGYFLHAIANQVAEPIALQRAAAAAALAVTQPGAISAIPSSEQVQRFLDAQNNN